MNENRGEEPCVNQAEHQQPSLPAHVTTVPAVQNRGKGRAPRKPLPTGVHLSYRQEYRTCGKTGCRTCQHGPGHGPYWYAYWREGGKVRSGYVGKVRPAQAPDRDRASGAERTAATYAPFLFSDENTNMDEEKRDHHQNDGPHYHTSERGSP